MWVGLCNDIQMLIYHELHRYNTMLLVKEYHRVMICLSDFSVKVTCGCHYSIFNFRSKDCTNTAIYHISLKTFSKAAEVGLLPKRYLYSGLKKDVGRVV